MKRVIYFILTPILCMAPMISRAQDEVELINPLGETDVRLIVAMVIKGALSVAGTLALLMFIYGGLLWLTDMGKGENVKKGRDILVWATLGVILIAGAYVATSAIFNALLTGNVSG